MIVVAGGWVPFLLFVIIPFFPDFQSSFLLMFPGDNRQEAEREKKTKHIRFSIASGTFSLLAGALLPLLS